MTKVCPGCGVEFVQNTAKQIYHVKSCGTNHRARTVYKHKFSVEYVARTPERYISSLLSYNGRRSTLSIEYMMGLYDGQSGLCALSGIEMTHIRGRGKVGTNISIDRIDSSRGYEEGNVQLVCAAVNRIKGDMTDEDFVDFCRAVVDYKDGNPRNNSKSNINIESKKKNRGRKK